MTLIARRIGYREWRGPVDLRGDSTPFVDVVLTPIAITLESMTATAAPSEPLAAVGFYDRLLDRNKGLGDAWFITPEELERRSPTRITQMLGEFPGITLLQGRYNASVPMGKGGTCVMAIYVDGARFFQHPSEAVLGTTADPGQGKALGALIARGGSTLDETVGPTSVAAIEIYPRAAQAPARFQPLNGACGVIVVWTKH
jgi:hypothetical protein